ncbi:hypothetical protein AB0M02_31890 [Actinoplanes sp. NPDC051861]|uniref:hypothetical protein n=1 Tax=Actinoplanes sp. NPDC051861 TaxID=3155170 RepID=UPI00343E40D8
MPKTLTRLAVTGALIAGALATAAGPAAAARPWVLMGYYDTYADCSRDGSAAVRGPVYSEYSCYLVRLNGYELWLR